MKVTRAGLLVLSCLAILSVAGIRARSTRYTAEPQLIFAQLTDTQLFDARLATDNWNALRWSINRINTLSRSGRQIDFVVYSGDLGLQNVAFSDSKTCPVKAVGEQDGLLPPAPERSASDKLVTELDRLSVRTVFFMSGNNDPSDEGGTDGRFDCFLLRLQEKAQVLNRPLRIQELGPDHCFALKGFRLLALSGASVDKTARLMREQVVSGEPTLLFTHVPDLKDQSRQRSAWDLEVWLRQEWKGEANHPNILGIFAGRLPDSTRGSFYGSSGGVKSLAGDSSVATKTYFAPPLAGRDQIGEPANARGFLLVTANRARIVSSEVQWFGSAR